MAINNYMAINQIKVLCIACLIRHITDWHHTVPRNKLSKEEKLDKKFQIGLCRRCHVKFTNHSTEGGYAFYKKYRLLLSIKQKCNYDERVLTTLEALRLGEQRIKDLEVI